MRERPIIFSGPMVRAILDGRKTMTRRVMKLPKWIERMGGDLSAAFPDKVFGVTPCLQVPCTTDGHGTLDPSVQRLRNPWLWPEPSHLWVKEKVALCMPKEDFPNGVAYWASDAHRCSPAIKWRSPMLMPRWASRITLEITGVRVERLQDISEDDAKAEGVEKASFLDLTVLPNSLIRGGRFPNESHIAGFGTAWDKMNAKKHPWASNPFVWVVEFRSLLDA